jgi:hypothetical protein
MPGRPYCVRKIDDLLAEIEGMAAEGPSEAERSGLSRRLADHFNEALVIAVAAADGSLAEDALGRWMAVVAVFATHLRSLQRLAESDPDLREHVADPSGSVIMKIVRHALWPPIRDQET